MALIKGAIRMIPYNEIPYASITPNTFVVSIADFGIPNFSANSQATILFPPYESIAYLLDGDKQRFAAEYFSYLNKEQPTKYILSVISAAMQGMDILFVLGREESTMEFPVVFIDYMWQQYGIIIGTNKNPGGFEEDSTPKLLIALYLYDLISCNEFMYLYPEWRLLDLRVPGLLDKLIYDLNPYMINRSLISYTDYFNNYKNSIKHNKDSIIAMHLGGNQQ